MNRVAGKLFAGLGGLLAGGPLGAAVGLLFGHALDKGWLGLAAPDPELQATRDVFLRTLFQTLGHLAKADGRVSEVEVAATEALMARMQLSEPQRRVAIRFFGEGKELGFALDAALAPLAPLCRSRPNLGRMFIEALLEVALADGAAAEPEVNVLHRVCVVFGLPEHEAEALIGMRAAYRPAPRKPVVSDPYAVLGLTRAASLEEVTRAYRKLISQHHPDKLVAKGLPAEMMKIAEEHTRAIRAAYEQIKSARAS